MLLWVVAVDVLLRARDAGPLRRDLWRRARARAHAAGSLFAVLAVNLWQGYAQWRRGRLDDALQSVGDATEQMPDVGRRRVWATRSPPPSPPASTSTVATSTRPTGWWRTLDRCRGSARVRGICARPPPGSGWPRAGPRRRWPRCDADVGHFDIANPAWAPWRDPAARALAALGRDDEALALADEQVALLRRWGAPSGARRRRCSWPVSCAARTGVPLLREAVDLLGADRGGPGPGPGPARAGPTSRSRRRRGGAVAARGGRRRA